MGCEKLHSVGNNAGRKLMIIENKKFEVSNHLKIDIKGWRKITSLTEEALIESLNYKPTINDVSADFNIPEGLNNFKVHETEDGDSLISFDKDGSTEIHHANKDDVSGKITSGSDAKNGPNSRFVSSMFHLGNQFLKDGKKVRIVAPNEMIEKYHRLANITKKQHGGVVSEIEHNSFVKTGKNTEEHKHFYISPPTKSIQEATHLLYKSR